MLDYESMKKMGKHKEVAFQEDADTFYASEAEPGVINGGFGNCTEEHLGVPEWGIRHGHPLQTLSYAL